MLDFSPLSGTRYLSFSRRVLSSSRLLHLFLFLLLSFCESLQLLLLGSCSLLPIVLRDLSFNSFLFGEGESLL